MPKKLDWNKKPPKQMVVLTKDGGAIVFNYGDNNIVPWFDHDNPSIYKITGEKIDTSLQRDCTDICIFRNGFLLSSRRDDYSWGGIRNKYSNDLKATLQALVDRGLATTSTPIWIGNWARPEDNISIGSIGKILSKPDIPTRLILYHGTSNYRAVKILRDGLNPINKDSRIWKKGSTKDILHRDVSVYLTSDLSRAEYYANKAVNTDKVRASRINWRKPWLTNSTLPNPDKITDQQKISWLKAHMDEDIMQLWLSQIKNRAMQWNKERYGITDESEYTLKTISSSELTSRMKYMLERESPYDPDVPTKIEPVVLKVLLGKADMRNLMADDDHIRTYNADPSDWMDSLSRFGQVAYKGSIPPNRIKIV